MQKGQCLFSNWNFCLGFSYWWFFFICHWAQNAPWNCEEKSHKGQQAIFRKLSKHLVPQSNRYSVSTLTQRDSKHQARCPFTIFSAFQSFPVSLSIITHASGECHLLNGLFFPPSRFSHFQCLIEDYHNPRLSGWLAYISSTVAVRPYFR